MAGARLALSHHWRKFSHKERDGTTSAGRDLEAELARGVEIVGRRGEGLERDLISLSQLQDDVWLKGARVASYFERIGGRGSTGTQQDGAR
jgi:hypothetical protein